MNVYMDVDFGVIIMEKYDKGKEREFVQIIKDSLVSSPASYTCIHAADDPVFVLSELPMLNVRPQVI